MFYKISTWPASCIAVFVFLIIQYFRSFESPIIPCTTYFLLCRHFEAAGSTSMLTFSFGVMIPIISYTMRNICWSMKNNNKT
jgi:hypothetical protein